MPRRVIGWLRIIVVPILGAGATKAGYGELANEQDRCAGGLEGRG